MNINKYLIIFKLLLFSGCLCEISEGEKEKLLNGFLEHYNSLPDQIYQSNEGSLQSTQQVVSHYIFFTIIGTYFKILSLINILRALLRVITYRRPLYLKLSFSLNINL